MWQISFIPLFSWSFYVSFVQKFFKNFFLSFAINQCQCRELAIGCKSEMNATIQRPHAEDLILWSLLIRLFFHLFHDRIQPEGDVEVPQRNLEEHPWRNSIPWAHPLSSDTIPRLVPGWTKAITIGRHAFGDQVRPLYRLGNSWLLRWAFV